MHGIYREGRTPANYKIYYVCPTLDTNPADKAKWPDHVRAAVREDVFNFGMNDFLDESLFSSDRRARLAELIPETQAQQDNLDHARADNLRRQLSQAGTAMDGIAAEMGQLAGKDDPASNAIRERLTTQFNKRYDEHNRLKAELDAIEETAPLPDNDLTLLDELPHALGLFAAAPDHIKEELLASLDFHAVYRQDTTQATVIVTLTDSTPATVARLAADPRVDSDTGAAAASPQADSPASGNTFSDVAPAAIAVWMCR